jgi:transcriptional regulator of met regulon
MISPWKRHEAKTEDVKTVVAVLAKVAEFLVKPRIPRGVLKY